MTDETPKPTSEAGATPPNYVARSALGILRRTARSLTPWVRSAWQSGSASVQRTTSQSAAESQSGATAPASRPALGLFRRVQRMSDTAAVLQTLPAARTGAALGRLSASVERHYPDVTRKYSPATQTESVQRAALPFGGGSPAPASPTVSITADAPVETPGDNLPPIVVAPDRSLTEQLAQRVMAMRNTMPQPEAQPPSPRQIGRKAADVSAARSTNPKSEKADKVVMRRAKVEEVGTRADDLMKPTAPVEPASNTPPVQRKAAEPARPARQPASRGSTGNPSWLSEPNPFPLELQPGVPSLSQQLAQRVMAQRAMEVKKPKDPEDDLPSWLRKDKTPKPAPAAPQTPGPVQRQPEIERKPVTKPAPRPAAPAASPAQGPTVQREPATRPPASSSETDGGDADSQPAGAPHSAVQRSPQSDHAPAKHSGIQTGPQQGSDLPLAANQTSATGRSEPSPSRLTVQRAETEPAAALADPAPRQTQSQPSPAAAPSVQRRAAADSHPPDAPMPAVEKKTPRPLPLAPAAATSAPVVQRSPAELPAQPPTASPAPAAEPVVNPAPSVQRRAAPKADQMEGRSVESPAAQELPSRIQRSSSETPLPTAAADLPLHRPAAPARPVRSTQPMPSVQRTTVSEPAGEAVDEPGSGPEGGAVIPAPPAVVQRSPIEHGAMAARPAPVAAARPLERTRLPLAPVARSVVQVQRAISSSVQVVDAPLVEPVAAPARPTAVSGPAPVVQRAPASVQRLNLPLAASVGKTSSKVQREATSESGGTSNTPSGNNASESGSSQSTAGMDLHALARKIYPLLRRMLAVERERR